MRLRPALVRSRLQLARKLNLVCLLFTLTIVASLSTELPAQALNYDSTNWRAYRTSLEQQFGIELQSIANWCRANRIPHQIDQTFKIYVNRDLGRQYIFLPDERPMPTLEQDVPKALLRSSILTM